MAEAAHPTAGDAVSGYSETEPLLCSSGSVHHGSRPGTAIEGDTPQDAIDPDAASHSLTRIRGVVVGVGLWLLISIQAANMSGITTIQGPIADSLDAHDSVMWFTTTYLVSLSCFAPLAGRFATIFPPRNLALAVSFFYVLGGLTSGLAGSLSTFLVGRALTGFGAGGVLSLAVVLVLQLTGTKRRGAFIGLVNAGYTCGVSLGAVVFGAAEPVFGWRPLFWLQAPVSIVAAAALYLGVGPAQDPVSKAHRDGNADSTMKKIARIDYIGALLLTSTIVLFLYGLAGSISTVPLFLSFICLAAFIATECYIAEDPIIPLQVLSSRGTLLSCAAQAGFMSARWTVLFFAPILMLAVRGTSPAAAGSILIPTNLGFALGGIVVGFVHVRRKGDFWLPSWVAVVCISASIYALSFMTRSDIPLELFILVVFLCGAATGATLTYALAHLLHLSTKDTAFISSSLLNTARGFGGSFGTAIGGGIFYRILRANLTGGFLSLDGDGPLTPERRRLISHLLGSPELVHGGNFTADEAHIAMDSYSRAMQTVWQAAGTLVIIMAFFQAATGWTAPKDKSFEIGGEEE